MQRLEASPKLRRVSQNRRRRAAKLSRQSWPRTAILYVGRIRNALDEQILKCMNLLRNIQYIRIV